MTSKRRFLSLILIVYGFTKALLMNALNLINLRCYVFFLHFQFALLLSNNVRFMLSLRVLGSMQMSENA